MVIKEVGMYLCEEIDRSEKVIGAVEQPLRALAPGVLFIDLKLTNTGTGHARNLLVNQISLRTLLGSGLVTHNATLSPAFPNALGNLNVGASTTMRLYLDVPSTVKRFSLTENGTAQNVAGTGFTYSVGQAVIP